MQPGRCSMIPRHDDSRGRTPPSPAKRPVAWYRARGQATDRLDLVIATRDDDRMVGEAVLGDLDADNHGCGFRTSLVGPSVGSCRPAYGSRRRPVVGAAAGACQVRRGGS
jgi:hypothetical protein